MISGTIGQSALKFYMFILVFLVHTSEQNIYSDNFSFEKELTLSPEPGMKIKVLYRIRTF